jgi:hypothetical protein
MLGDMKILKCFHFCLSISYMDNSIQRRYKIDYQRHYSIHIVCCLLHVYFVLLQCMLFSVFISVFLYILFCYNVSCFLYLYLCFTMFCFVTMYVVFFIYFCVSLYSVLLFCSLTLFVQFMFILTRYKYMVWFTEYDTCQHTTVCTANIHTSTHCKYKQHCTLVMYMYVNEKKIYLLIVSNVKMKILWFEWLIISLLKLLNKNWEWFQVYLFQNSNMINMFNEILIFVSGKTYVPVP